jgi:hypothetical protein
VTVEISSIEEHTVRGVVERAEWKSNTAITAVINATVVTVPVCNLNGFHDIEKMTETYSSYLESLGPVPV